MVKSKKASERINDLQLELQVKDKLLGAILSELLQQKIKLSESLLKIIEALYVKKTKTN